MHRVLSIFLILLGFNLQGQKSFDIAGGIFHTPTYYKRAANTNVIAKIGISAPSYKIQGSYSFPIDSVFNVCGILGTSVVRSKSAGGNHVLFQSGHLFTGIGVKYQKQSWFARLNFLGDIKLYETDFKVQDKYFAIQPSIGLHVSKKWFFSIESTVYLTPYFKYEPKPYSNRGYWSLIGINLGYKF